MSRRTFAACTALMLAVLATPAWGQVAPQVSTDHSLRVWASADGAARSSSRAIARRQRVESFAIGTLSGPMRT